MSDIKNSENQSNKKLESQLAEWILNNRAVVLLVSDLFLAASVYGAKFLSFSTNYRIFFGPDNPQLLAYNKVEETFTKSDNIFFLIHAKEGNIFTPENFAAIDELTEASWQVPFSYRVDSITNYQHTKAENDDLLVDKLIAFAEDQTPESYRKLEVIALNEPSIAHRLISDDSSVAGLNISMQYPPDDPTAVVTSAAYAKEMKAAFEEKYPHLDVYLTGSTMINNAMMEASTGDIKLLLPTMYAIMVVLLMILLRSIVSVLTIVVLIAISIAGAFGIAGYIGVILTPPAISSTTVIVTIVVAHCVHVLVTFFQQMRQGKDQKAAMQESLRINIQPVFLTSLTTMIGFLSLNISDVPPMQDFGNIVAAGVFFAFVFSLGILPVIVGSIPVKVKPREEGEKRIYMDVLADFVIRHQTKLLFTFLFAGLFLSALSPLNVINDRFSKYFDEKMEFRVASDFADETLAGLYGIEFIMDSGQADGITDPRYLKDIERFSLWLEEQPEVKHVTVFSDTMKRLNKSMHDDDPAYYRLPENKALAAQYLLLYEMSLPYGLDLNNVINYDKSATRLVVTLPSLHTSRFIAFQNRAIQWQKENLPDYEVFEGAHMSLMFTYIGYRAMSSSVKGAVIALVLISLIILFSLRSMRLGLVSFIPNLLPAGVGFGIWALTNGNIGLSVSTALGITMGIVVDDTVHFLSKYQRAVKELGLKQEEAIRYAFHNVGVALWVTTFVLTVGFLILSLSAFKPNGDLGLLAAIIIVVALVLDFLLLPPLLMRFARKA